MISISGFEIIEKLAEGAVFRSYKARQKNLDRLVMIKEFIVSEQNDQARFESLVKEAKRAARLKHAGILQLFDALEEGGARFLVMELPVGMTVTQLISSIGNVPQKRALEIIQDVARAMEFTWIRSSLVHGAITADMVTLEEGAVKVVGIGLGGVGPEGHGMPAPWVTDPLQRNPYLAPETQTGGKAGLRTDIYAAGIILGYMVNGSVPEFARVAPGQAPSLRKLAPPPGVAPAVWNLVMRMTEPDMENRPEKWAEVIRTIDKLLAEGQAPAPVEKASQPAKAQPPARPAKVISMPKKQIVAGSGDSPVMPAITPAPRMNPLILAGSWAAVGLLWVGIAWGLWHKPSLPPLMERKPLPARETQPESPGTVSPAKPPEPPPPAVKPAPHAPVKPFAVSTEGKLEALVANAAECILREDFAAALNAIDAFLADERVSTIHAEARNLREFINQVAGMDERIADNLRAKIGSTVTIPINGQAVNGVLKGVEVGKIALEQKIDRQTQIITRNHTVDIIALGPVERARWLGPARTPAEHAMRFILGAQAKCTPAQLGVDAAASGPMATVFMKLIAGW